MLKSIELKMGILALSTLLNTPKIPVNGYDFLSFQVKKGHEKRYDDSEYCVLSVKCQLYFERMEK